MKAPSDGANRRNFFKTSLIGLGGVAASGSLLGTSSAVAGTTNAVLNIVTPEQYGARGDGVNDDTQAVQSAVNEACSKQSLVLLSANYLVSQSIVPPASIRVLWTGRITASERGIFNSITKGGDGSDRNTDLNVIWDAKQSSHSTHMGRALIFGAKSQQNLVAVGVSVLGHGGAASSWEHLETYHCKYALYGQDTNKAINGALTGCHFGTVFGGGGGIYLGTCSDDCHFDVIRNATLTCCQTNTSVGSFYGYGTSPDAPIISLGGQASLTAQSIFLEGVCKYGIIMNSTASSLTVLDLRVSNAFSSSNDAIITCGQTGSMIDITVNFFTLECKSLVAVVALYTQPNSERIVRIRYPYPWAKLAPLVYAGGALSSADQVEVQGTDGRFFLKYINGAVKKFTMALDPV